MSRLAVDRDGLLYVLEALDQQIRVYDGGELLRRIGRRGDGPGEFQRAARFGVKGDTVWVIEHLVPYEQRLTLCAAALVTGADVRSSGAGAGGDAAFSSSPRRSGSACPAPDIV